MGYLLAPMKTTLDISDNLLSHAKQLAHEQKVTLRSLVEEGLAKTLREHAQRQKQDIQPVVFSGKGLNPDFQGKSWQTIRNAAYGEHRE